VQLAASSEFATFVGLMRINAVYLQLTLSAGFRENTLRGAVKRAESDLEAHFPFSTSIAYCYWFAFIHIRLLNSRFC
jgi:hypothetical protein